MDDELTWKPFSRDRLIRTDVRGFTVIRPATKATVVPLCCPICDLMMRTGEDVQKWHESGCCAKCSMKWVEPDRSKWESGWRPDAREVSIEVQSRLAIPIGVKLDGAG